MLNFFFPTTFEQPLDLIWPVDAKVCTGANIILFHNAHRSFVEFGGGGGIKNAQGTSS